MRLQHLTLHVLVFLTTKLMLLHSIYLILYTAAVIQLQQTHLTAATNS
jgi:hypothetical protein